MQLNVESAALDSANDAVSIELLDGADMVTFELVYGTLSGSTVTFEAQGPSGTWYALGCTPSTGAAVATTATAAGLWQANIAGFRWARMRLSTAGTGAGTGYAVTGK